MKFGNEMNDLYSSWVLECNQLFEFLDNSYGLTCKITMFNQTTLIWSTI